MVKKLKQNTLKGVEKGLNKNENENENGKKKKKNHVNNT